MVKLEEVADEEFMKEQPGPHDEDDWDTDDGTSHSSISSLCFASPPPRNPCI